MRRAAAVKLGVLAVLVGTGMGLGSVFGRADEQPDRKAMEAELKKACEVRDLDRVDRVALALAEAGGEDAVKALVGLAKRIPPGDEGLYWRLVRGAASVRDEGGVLALAEAIIDNAKAPISRDLMFRFQSNRSPRAVKLHERVLEKGPADLRLMAADQLAAIEAVDSVDALVVALEREEKGKDGEVKEHVARALEVLCGTNCGTALDWKRWWAARREHGLPEKGSSTSSTGTVVDDLDGARRWEYPILEKLKPGDVIVARTDCKGDPNGARACNFDAIEDVLARMNIPHTVALKKDIDKGIVTLDNCKVLIVTCTQILDHCVCPNCKAGGTQSMRLMQCTGCDKHEIVNHKFSADSIKKIKAFVERGGYLFTEDWGLNDVLVRAWPKSFVGPGKNLGEDTVDTVPARGRTSHSLLRGMFVDPPKAAPAGDPAGGDTGTVTRDPGHATEETPKVERNWKIDKDSPAIKILGNGVTVLMTSDKLRKLATGDDSVAVTFLPLGEGPESVGSGAGTQERGKGSAARRGGRVLHVLSHFGKQSSSEDEFALQNLLLNFLLEANREAPQTKQAKPAKQAK